MSVAALAKKAKCKLIICTKEESMDDRWMQVRGPRGRRARSQAPGAWPSAWLAPLPQMGQGLGASECPHRWGFRRVTPPTLTVAALCPPLSPRRKPPPCLKTQVTSGNAAKLRGLELNQSLQWPSLRAGLSDQATALCQPFPWLCLLLLGLPLGPSQPSCPFTSHPMSPSPFWASLPMVP